MTLTRRLAHTLLSYPCPSCGHVLEKAGSWFTTVGRYECAGCLEVRQLGYDAKVQLFAEHIRLHPFPDA